MHSCCANNELSLIHISLAQNEHCCDGIAYTKMDSIDGKKESERKREWESIWCDMNEFLIAYYEFYAYLFYLLLWRPFI